jgi:hypothetical protein
MTPFQGDLKKRSDKDISDLAESLIIDGLLMPFALWKTEDKLFLLDGHGRMQALIRIALTDVSVLTQSFPVLMVQADNEEEARKALLQITSTYGKISKAGVIKFAAPVANYKAPILTKTKPSPIVKTEKSDDMILVRIRVAKEMVAELMQLLKQVNGIEVI